MELLDRAASVVVGDEVAKLAEDVCSRLDELLVRRRGLQVLEHNLGGVRLQVLRVGHNLNHTVPNLVRDVVARQADQLQDCTG